MNDRTMQARARLGAAARWGDPDTEAQARRDLTEAKLRRAVDEALRAEPPLPAEVLADVAALLQGGA